MPGRARSRGHRAVEPRARGPLARVAVAARGARADRRGATCARTGAAPAARWWSAARWAWRARSCSPRGRPASAGAGYDARRRAGELLCDARVAARGTDAGAVRRRTAALAHDDRGDARARGDRARRRRRGRPGMSRHADTVRFVHLLLPRLERPAVLDADALPRSRLPSTIWRRRSPSPRPRACSRRTSAKWRA